MSYLDIPRIHFAGRFFTDPSTVNNDPTHYNPDVVTPSPWQNPDGQHRFQFRNCKITSAVGPSGFVNNDPVIGAAFETNDQPHLKPGPSNPAKIVDIDVYQQCVSTIYGMQLKLTVGDVSIIGMADPPTLNLCWFNAVLPTRSWEPGDYEQDSFGGDMNACGNFQSVIRFNPSDWPQTSSGILNSLRSTTITINGQLVVAFKFVVDGYRNVPIDQDYQTGRIVGTIGPLFANEPMYNPGQRWLMPRAFSQTDEWNFPSFNNCPFKVDSNRNKLILDLANSICRQTAGGPPVDLGTVNAMVSTPDPVTANLGVVDYSEFAYQNNAHITEMDLNEAQLEMLQSGQLTLVMSRNDIGNPTIFTEPQTDVQFGVEKRVILMEGDPGTTATTTVYVSKRGIPLAGKQLKLFTESVHGDTPGATVPPTNPGDTPQADGALDATISVTDENGFATITFTVLKDPGQRTPELDGQLYFIIAYDPDYPRPDWSNPKGPQPPQDQMVSCKVFSQYTVNQNPSWPEIQSMMAPYMKLYPGMRKLIDLSDRHTFTIFGKNPPWDQGYGDNNAGPLGIQAGAIAYYMSRDFNDPRLMPVSRDLSQAKILTIMYFIKNLQSQS
jgi:hypothetical protein